MAEHRDGVENAAGKADGGGESPGESGGGAYPNPHTGKTPEGGGFMGHGGQTQIEYSGTGEGSGDEDADVGNANAVTGKS